MRAPGVVPADPVADLLRRAVRLLAEAKGESWVHKASIWPMMKRLDSTIDLKSQGFEGFSEMLKAKESIVEVKKGETDHMVRLK